MARRFRYSFTKKKEAPKGKLSVALAISSLVLFAASVVLAFRLEGERFGFLYGSIGLFASLLSAYGFLMGLSSFSERNCKHRASMIGSIANGFILVAWIGLFLMGIK
ncbi:MAG: hypothetical protein Q4B26_11525 [Eubacteriales bacterium]|nr:hypothetical protein [Eubacteriales bacterium]